MNFLINVIKGMMIGIANVIPGVSGGTMAVSLGIYDKMIDSISGILKHLRDSIAFLFPLVIGMGIGMAIGQAKDKRLSENIMIIRKVETANDLSDIIIHVICKNEIEKQYIYKRHLNFIIKHYELQSSTLYCRLAAHLGVTIFFNHRLYTFL